LRNPELHPEIEVSVCGFVPADNQNQLTEFRHNLPGLSSGETAKTWLEGIPVIGTVHFAKQQSAGFRRDSR
jgi:hypothetical protein